VLVDVGEADVTSRVVPYEAYALNVPSALLINALGI